jgi:hypothetical protein
VERVVSPLPWPITLRVVRPFRYSIYSVTGQHTHATEYHPQRTAQQQQQQPRRDKSNQSISVCVQLYNTYRCPSTPRGISHTAQQCIHIDINRVRHNDRLFYVVSTNIFWVGKSDKFERVWSSKYVTYKRQFIYIIYKLSTAGEGGNKSLNFACNLSKQQQHNNF